jgi:FkbM family methyltransferase
MLTAAVRDLHLAAPGRFQTDVRTSTPALWENNPHITAIGENEPGVQSLDMHYPLIHQSNQRPHHFLQGYCAYLEERLGLRVPVTRFAGDIHLAQTERNSPPPGADQGVPSRFWIVVAGGKYDFTAKWWNPASYQAVVDHFRGRTTFVQCGEAGHWHPPLSGVVNMVGRTTTRELIRLVFHAEGVLCPVTFAMHLAAAVPAKPGGPAHRPCVVVAGGREPPHWEAYPQHRFLSTVGALTCCASGGCWRSRCQLVGDGDEKDRNNVCEQPVQVSADLRIPKCMTLITPDDVVRSIELYYKGGILPPLDELDSLRRQHALAQIGTPDEPSDKPPSLAPTATKVLIRFRHGLGDAVQLTSVLAHLRHYHPDWEIDVATGIGKHSAFPGLCRTVIVSDRQPVDSSGYDRVFDPDWLEPTAFSTDAPATKAERCLQELFGLQPLTDLCRYSIRKGVQADVLACRYLRRVCHTGPGAEGRFPNVLIHYEGNTSRAEKDLPLELARALCAEVLAAGAVPVILDWDRRTPLADGASIYNPHADEELWGATGTGDAEVLAALIERSTLLVAVDSGPLHVAGATTTPTIGVWLRHHPLHYFGLADNVLHLVPEDHQSLVRGDRAAGTAFFNKHYRYRPYHDLAIDLRAAVRQRLCPQSDGLVLDRGFWIRADNASQDLVVVGDVAERDCYRVAEFPMPRPVVVDVGAHIGCFSKCIHGRNPLARVFAVECCAENLPALRKNVGPFATVVQAALTYESDVGVLNAVYPGCASTGGSIVVSRSELRRRLDAGEILGKPGAGPGDYWADLRPLRTLTLERLMQEQSLERIDILKLDCEGSELSILRGTTSLDRIGLIVGEYHGKAAFLGLVQDRFPGWDLRLLHDGDPGTFWLTSPSAQHTNRAAVSREDVETPSRRILAAERDSATRVTTVYRNGTGGEAADSDADLSTQSTDIDLAAAKLPAAQLTIDGVEAPLGAEFSLRWVGQPGGSPQPALYRGGKRVTRAWSLRLSIERPADPAGGNANTE